MLRDLLEIWEPEVLPKSAMGDAIGYTLRQWETLIVYVKDGRLEIDNTAIERAIRGTALGRRNFLFVGSEQGGHDAALYYSLIESCRGAGVEPMEYLTDVIGRIGDVPESEVAELLPARWKAAPDAQRAADAN
jgi:transposase